MKTLVMLTFLFSFSTLSQTLDEDLKGIRFNEGKMFTLQVVPGSRRLKVNVVGKTAMEAGPDRVVVFGRVISESGQARELKIQPTGAHFVIVDQLEKPAKVEIEIKDKKTEKAEVIQSKP